MEDQTTTDASVASSGQAINGVAIDDQGMAIPQLENTEPAEAVSEAIAEPEQQTEESTESVSEDTELASWAEKKGLTLDSDNTTKAAKMAREAERAMHQKAQRASELEKNLTTTSDDYAEQVAANTGQDPELLKRLQRVEVKDAVRDFWDNNPQAKEYEQAMISELQAKPHLAGDLESLYATAVMKSGSLDAVKSQGKREALESLAQKQQAAVPRGNAVNGASSSNAITPQNVDQMVASHDQKWFEANYDRINKAMAA